MDLNLKLIASAVLEQYALPVHGCHGISHWARVLENGRRLSSVTGGNLAVVTLFALLHDACRETDFSDPNHGARAASFARDIRGSVFDLGDPELELLCRACEGHTHERTHPDITIQCCWDADRLDLGRVGVLPDPNRLCTKEAKRPATIQWADGRAAMKVVPSLIKDELDLDPAVI